MLILVRELGILGLWGAKWSHRKGHTQRGHWCEGLHLQLGHLKVLLSTLQAFPDNLIGLSFVFRGHSFFATELVL